VEGSFSLGTIVDCRSGFGISFVLVLISGVAGAIEIVLDNVVNWGRKKAQPQFDTSSTSCLEAT